MVSAADARSFEAALVRHCAPTLAGLKPGCIFSQPARESVRRGVLHWDGRLRALGLSVRILLDRPEDRGLIVYVYRRRHLEEITADPACREFLGKTGYPDTDLDGLLAHLARRLQTQSEFPHEIGVFLGYPLGDVIGFIENRGENFTCCGCWKSYGDPAGAQACFDRYRSCVRAYVDLYERGIPIEQLAVPA